MIVDGNAIASQVYHVLEQKISTLAYPPRLTVFTCAPTFETQKYLALKRKKAEMIGIVFHVVELPHTADTETCIKEIERAKKNTDAIVVQLPLPPQIDRDEVLSHIPETHDVDALNPKTKEFLSPVVASIRVILETHDVTPRGKQVVVLGQGKLVGSPVAKWFREHGASVSTVDRDSGDISAEFRSADIVVSGVGIPGIITPDSIDEQTILLDAGTSEDGGQLRGDAHPDCASHAKLFTPVPGGIGPITIAMLLNNVVKAASR